MRKRWLAFIVAAALIIPTVAIASESEHEVPTAEQIGLSYDPVTWERGHIVFRDVCNTCHGLKLHRDPQTNMPYYAGGAQSPEEEAEKQDGFEAAFGKVPPDLSILAKAKIPEGSDGKRIASGAAYIHEVLTGWVEKPEEVEDCTAGTYNQAFPGNCIAMPPQTLTEQQAKDVSSFLWYVAEPTLMVREELGNYVIPFSLILTALLYVWKRQMWAPIKAKKKAKAEQQQP